MDFAFLVHPLSDKSTDLLSWSNQGIVNNLWGSDLLQFSDSLHEGVNQAPDLPEPEFGTSRIIDSMTKLFSPAGGRAEGKLVEIPMSAYAILENPTQAVELIADAVEDAADWGAKIVGLGSITGVVGGRGAYVAESSPIAITTGNSLTVYAALEQLRQACSEGGLDLSQETVAVVGIPGSIGAAAARILANECKRLILVGRRPSSRATRLAKELDAELVLELPKALERSRVIFTATSVGNCIDQHQLVSGSIVIDVAVPADIMQIKAQRKDVLLISGGLARVPESMAQRSPYLLFHHGVIPSCMGETMTLALEDRMENFSLGRDLSVPKIQEIGLLAKKHGFDFSGLYSFGVPLNSSKIIEFRKSITRERSYWNAPGSTASHLATNGHQANGNGKPRKIASPEELADKTSLRHTRHINPVLTALGGKDGFARTIVRSEGCYFWDEKGNKILDFVAGFGSLNLGHNHPAVAEAIQVALRNGAPGFCQTALNPYAAKLAERLVEFAPSGLEMVFFTNSGTESVEAALKLARAATKRTGLLSCKGSYHGKTLGALSVTAKQSYQQPFAPLVPGCEAIPYGDIESLERQLTSEKYAAFVVEPLQGEGGMNVPSPQFLQAAQELCRKTGTLLVVDEVQTGLGRTGTMFAVDAMDVEPDVMCLAKSLGGGLMPIGAMLTRSDLWKKAYGTVGTFALHSSTFGGGSLASAAGLATLDALSDSQLVANVGSRSKQLHEGLEKICRSSRQVIKEYRGKGLMCGIELQPFDPLIAAHWGQGDKSGAQQYFMPDWQEMMSSMPAIYLMNTLLSHHKIYTQVARSNPLVLRIQPPLVISEQEVDYFLTSLGKIIDDMEKITEFSQAMLTKSHIGVHEAAEEKATPTVKEPPMSPKSEPAKRFYPSPFTNGAQNGTQNGTH